MFWKKTNTIDWHFLVPALVVLGACISVFLVIAIFVSQRLVSVRPYASGALTDDKAASLNVAQTYEQDLQSLEKWLQDTKADQALMIKKTEAAFFSAHVPAARRDKHLQTVIAVRKLSPSVAAASTEDIRQQLLRMVRSLLAQK